MIYKALSIQQPWAYLILHHGKDIENRDWYTNYRGTILIHAGKKLDKEAYEFICGIGYPKLHLPPRIELPMGGIVGQVDIVGCVKKWDSPWFEGKYGFVLENPKPLTLIPCRGKLGIFDIDITI